MLATLSFRKLVALFGLVSLLCVGILTIGIRTDAQPTGWTSNDVPYLKVGEEEVASSFLMPGNRDCYQQTFTTFVYKKLGFDRLDASPTETPVESPCTITNQLGSFGNNYISPNTGHGYWAHLNGSPAIIVGVPNQPVFMVTRSASTQGRTLHLYRDIRSNGKFDDRKVVNGYSGIVYNLNQLKPALKDSLNQPLAVHEYAFSENGEWMAAEVVGIGLVRINMLTEQMALFSSETFNRGQGFSVDATLAISNDGKYALKSGRNSGETFVYDISSCQNTNVFSIYTRPTTGCGKKSIQNFLAQNIGRLEPGHVFWLNSMRFSQDSRIIRGIVISGPDSAKKLARKITLSIDPIVDSPGQSYIAMGDSFASGEGDMDDNYYEDGTNEESVNMCHLSKRSYPYLIASSFQPDEFHSVACSGATINNIFHNSQWLASRINTSLGQYIPGKEYQFYYIKAPYPSFITLSIGGNDLGFLSTLSSCLQPTNTCEYATNEDKRGDFAVRIASQYAKLKKLYEEIANKTNKQTKIYVIGYPQFLDANSNSCGKNVWFNPDERRLVQKSIEYTNQIIKAATKAAGAYYVDAEDALEGYTLCSDIPQSQMAVNGITLGNDKYDIPWFMERAGDQLVRIISSNILRTTLDLGIGNESFHPNQNGHELLKKEILAKTHGSPVDFKVCDNPTEKICPNSNNAVPLPDGYFGPQAATFVDCMNKYECLDGVVEQFKNIATINTEVSKVFVDNLKSGSQAKVEIHSTPTEIGTFTVNEQGVLDTEITIPDSISPGFHEIHVIGQDIAGRPVEYYQPVFMTGPEGDLNANSVPDNQEQCGLTGDTGVDEDQDGIDDGCDGHISEPPLATENKHTETRNVGIISLMNSGQNVSGLNASHLGFSQDTGLQSSNSVPQTSNNSLQGTGSSNLTNSNNAANLLNQTQVLGSTSTATKTPETNLNNASQANYVGWVLIAVVIFAALFYLLVRKSED